MKTAIRKVFGRSALTGFVAIALACLTGASAASAQVLAEPPAAKPDYAAWFEDYFETQIKRQRTIGAAVVVVTPEEVLVRQGYGYGDYGSREPIHPDVTFIPIADLGNLILGQRLTALRDAQQLSFDQPANTFVTRVQLPGSLSHLSVSDLASGAAGLTASPRGSLTLRGSSDSGLRAIKQHLFSGTPPPDTNRGSATPVGSALLSLLLEDVTGQSVEAHLEEALAQELGLNPYFNLPGSDLPKYYVHQHVISRYGDVTQEPVHASPPLHLTSNGVHLTLKDIGALLGIILQDVMKDNASPLWLEPRDTQTDGTAFGISGAVQTVTTDLLLLPDQDMAVFVMLTGTAKSPDFTAAKGRERLAPPLVARDVTQSFRQAFIDAQLSPTPSPAPFAVSALLGTYAPAPQKLERPEDFFMQSQSAQVALGEDGKLRVNGVGPLAAHTTANTYVDVQTGLEATFAGAGEELVLGGARLTRQDEPGQRGILLAGMLVAAFFALQLMRAVTWPVKRRAESLTAWVGALGALIVLALLGLPTFAYFNGWPSPYLETSIFSLLPLLIWATAGMAVVLSALMVWSWAGMFWALDGRGFVRRRQFTFGALGLVALTYLMVQVGLMPMF